MFTKLEQFVREFVANASFRSQVLINPQVAVAGLSSYEREGALAIVAQYAAKDGAREIRTPKAFWF